MFRPLIVVLGELAYLSSKLRFSHGARQFTIRELHRMAVHDLYRGSQESKEALLEKAFWWEDGPDGRTRILKNTPKGPETLFIQVV